jgi:hypothetical protein
MVKIWKLSRVLDSQIKGLLRVIPEPLATSGSELSFRIHCIGIL